MRQAYDYWQDQPGYYAKTSAAGAETFFHNNDVVKLRGNFRLGEPEAKSHIHTQDENWKVCYSGVAMTPPEALTFRLYLTQP